MAENTPLGNVYMASWLCPDEETRRICSLIIAHGEARVKDNRNRRFFPGCPVWNELESLGCDIEDKGNGMYRVSVKGARSCYTAGDFARRPDVDRG